MPSYVITGVSRGIGWGYLTVLSKDPNNTIIGLVRNKPATDKRVSEELGGRSNIHILQADIADYEALEKAATDTAAITGGSLDYIIANACDSTTWDFTGPIDELISADPKFFAEKFHKAMDVNVLANVNLFHLFMPLILKGTAKKVLFISSAHADLDFVNFLEMEIACLYAASKAAMNMLVAKFASQYKKDGVLFMSMCPGMVDTGVFNHLAPEEAQKIVMPMVEKLTRYAPNLKGAIPAVDAAANIIKVLESKSVEHRDNGVFVSRYGNTIWS